MQFQYIQTTPLESNCKSKKEEVDHLLRLVFFLSIVIPIRLVPGFHMDSEGVTCSPTNIGQYDSVDPSIRKVTLGYTNLCEASAFGNRDPFVLKYILFVQLPIYFGRRATKYFDFQNYFITFKDMS